MILTNKPNDQTWLGDHVKYLEIQKIPMVGNPYSSSLIGLDETGKAVIERLRSQSGMAAKALQQVDQELYQALQDGAFLGQSPGYQLESAYLHITSRCNLNCTGCYSFEEGRNQVAEADTDQMKDALRQLRQAGVRQLVISGGEPLLRSDLLTLLAYARQNLGFESIQLITNGTLEYNHWSELGRYLDNLSFSLDGYCSEVSYLRPQGILPRILANAQAARRHVPINFIVTLHRQNLDQLAAYQALADQAGASLNISLFAAEPSDYHQDYILQAKDYHKLTNLVVKHQMPIADSALENDIGCAVACGAGKTIISVQSTGEVMPCHMFFGDQFSLGNLFDTPLSDILANRFNNAVCRFDVDTIERCQSCQYKYLCGAGCRYRAYCTTGSAVSSDPLCDTYLAHFDQVFSNIAQSFSEERRTDHAI